MTKTTRIFCLGIVLSFATLTANAAPIQTYGDVTSGPGGYTLTSDTSGVGYAGIYYNYSSAPITLDSISNLSADYQFLQGTIGPGAPRFSIIDTTGNPLNEAYVYFGTPTGTGSFTEPGTGTTGNYVTSADLRVQINGFNGDTTGAGYITFSDFLLRDGSALVKFITLDLDAGFAGTQQILVSNFDVAAAAGPAAPEPSTWAMMMLGFAGIGFMTYRRRKGAAVTA